LTSPSFHVLMPTVDFGTQSEVAVSYRDGEFSR
jgi:hypothetical protein